MTVHYLKFRDYRHLLKRRNAVGLLLAALEKAVRLIDEASSAPEVAGSCTLIVEHWLFERRQAITSGKQNCAGAGERDWIRPEE